MGKLKNVFIHYDGINFKSKLECNVYKKLKENGLNAKYESKKFVLQKSQKLNISNYLPTKSKDGLKNIPIIREISYTIDFFIEVKKDGKHYEFFIEAKGFPNDAYPIKKKMFLNAINKKQNSKEIYFFEVHNNKQIDHMINIIKRVINN